MAASAVLGPLVRQNIAYSRNFFTSCLPGNRERHRKKLERRYTSDPVPVTYSS